MDVRHRPASSGRLATSGRPAALGAMLLVLVLVLVCVLPASAGAASGRARSRTIGSGTIGSDTIGSGTIGSGTIGSGTAADAAGPAASDWVWPLSGPPPVVRGFDPPDVRWHAGHRGVDLLAGPGSVVLAAGGGVVSFAGPLAGRGVVTVRHGDGTRTTYQPVAATVVRGDRVEAGHPLGRLSAAGGHCPPRACLHWGRLRGEVYLDPLALVGRRPVRLLPVWGPVRPPAATGATQAAGRVDAGSAVVGATPAPTAPGAPKAAPDWRLAAAAGAGGAVLAALLLLGALRPVRRRPAGGRGSARGAAPAGVVDLADERARRRRDHPRVIA